MIEYSTKEILRRAENVNKFVFGRSKIQGTDRRDEHRGDERRVQERAVERLDGDSSIVRAHALAHGDEGARHQEAGGEERAFQNDFVGFLSLRVNGFQNLECANIHISSTCKECILPMNCFR